MRHCPEYPREYQRLPLVCKDPTKRKRQGRGRWNNKRKAPVDESSSATDSPMKKVNLTFLTEWTSDSDVELLEVKVKVSRPASSEEEQTEEEEEGEEEEGEDWVEEA